MYLRSDQDQPFIARIDRMWTDAKYVMKLLYSCTVLAPVCNVLVLFQSEIFIFSGDPWIRGPWFVRPSEVVHNPTRMFYDHELFMSNIQDTNPMRSICGKCTVLNITDYYKSKTEDDFVFVCLSDL